jgi:rhodanese-related sulfurtransferase
MKFIKKLFGKSGQPVANPEPVSVPEPNPEPEPEPMKINEILPDQLQARLENGDDLLVVDMRQGWEYHAGHIPGALHMFIQEIPQRMNELPKDTDVVLQCWHGNTSLDASAFLIQNGWSPDRVFSLSGGMAGWVSTCGVESLGK